MCLFYIRKREKKFSYKKLNRSILAAIIIFYYNFHNWLQKNLARIVGATDRKKKMVEMSERVSECERRDEKR